MAKITKSDEMDIFRWDSNSEWNNSGIMGIGSYQEKYYKLSAQLTHEENLRQKYPALKEAYDQYQLVLKFVSNNGDEL